MENEAILSFKNGDFGKDNAACSDNDMFFSWQGASTYSGE